MKIMSIYYIFLSTNKILVYNKSGDKMKKKFMIILFMFLLIDSVWAKEKVTFSKCVDGDTIKVMINKKEYTVRFLAVDTPETKHPKKKEEPYGKEASNYTCDRVKYAKKIELEYDKGSTKEDKYGRKLAWVFVDNKLLQEELIERGYAKVAYLYGDYKYTNKLKKTEAKSKEEKLGIWSDKEEEDNDIVNAINDIINRFIDKILSKIKTML